MKTKVVVVAALLGCALGRCAVAESARAVKKEYIHVQVVDTEGVPIEGAKSEIDYWQYRRNPKTNELEHREFQMVATSDKAGRFVLPVSDVFKVQRAHDPSKDGYRFEVHLNRDRSDYLNPQIHTQEHPFRFVLRKVLDEKAHLLYLGTARRNKASAVDGNVKFDIDLFGSCEECKKYSKHVPYVDFSVVAHLDDKKGRWDIVLKTDNADTGIIATTNRVYMAPTAGYAKRVEVSQEMYKDQAFTIYLYTRKPKVYAMLQFPRNGYGQLAETGSHGYFTFGYDCARINPTGSPLMESDESMDASPVMHGFTERCISALLEEHRYPPRPDIAARKANRRKWKELEVLGDQCFAEIRKYREEKDAILQTIKGHNLPEDNDELAQLQRKINDKDQEMRKCVLEQSRLDKELVSLFEPECDASSKQENSQIKTK